MLNRIKNSRKASASIADTGSEKVVNISDRRRKKPLYKGSVDFILFAAVIGLVLFGIVMVFSASYYTAMSREGTPYYYLFRDCIWAIIGTGTMLFLATCDYHFLKKLSWLIMGVAFILLFIVLINGKEINNAKRWIDLKVITLMPGELAKPAVIIFIAALLSNDSSRIRDFRWMSGLFFLAGSLFYLIYKQPNLSTAGTVVIIIFGMMFIAGMNILGLLSIGGIGFLGLVALIIAKGGFHLERIISFRHPENELMEGGYQVYQSLLALGSGGIFGVGIGNSIQKTLYLPEPQNDFILAIIGEELGYAGLIILLTLYLVVIWRCVHIAMHAPDMFGRLMSAGFSVMFSAHVIFNILIVTAWMPPTGIILPFVSWGGNALVIFMACIGIMLSISRQSSK